MTRFVRFYSGGGWSRSRPFGAAPAPAKKGGLASLLLAPVITVVNTSASVQVYYYLVGVAGKSQQLSTVYKVNFKDFFPLSEASFLINFNLFYILLGDLSIRSKNLFAGHAFHQEHVRQSTAEQ